MGFNISFIYSSKIRFKILGGFNSYKGGDKVIWILSGVVLILILVVIYLAYQLEVLKRTVYKLDEVVAGHIDNLADELRRQNKVLKELMKV